VEAIDRLHLDYEATVYEKIDSEIVANPVFAIDDRNPSLTLHLKVVRRQFEGETVAVDGFEEARAEGAVNGHRVPDDGFCQSVDIVDCHAGRDQHESRRR